MSSTPQLPNVEPLLNSISEKLQTRSMSPEALRTEVYTMGSEADKLITDSIAQWTALPGGHLTIGQLQQEIDRAQQELDKKDDLLKKLSERDVFSS